MYTTYNTWQNQGRSVANSTGGALDPATSTISTKKMWTRWTGS